MARVKAKILTVGTHHSPQGEVVVTPERLKHWDEQFKKMKLDMNIPAPWNHQKNALPGNEDFLKSPQNAGYVEEFNLSKDGKSAHIVIDAPGVTVEDGKLVTWTKLNNSDAMVKTAVKEVSAGIAKAWKDGKNRTWNDVLTHAAIVIHPVVGGQDGFKQLSQEMGEAQWLSVGTKWNLASDFPGDAEPPDEKKDDPPPEKKVEPEPPTGFSMETLIKDLSGEPFRLMLPPDTNEENFAERLWIAVSALKGQHGAASGVQEHQPEQMMMSLLSKTNPEQAKVLQKLIDERNAFHTKEKTRRFDGCKKSLEAIPLPVDVKAAHFAVLESQNLSLDAVSDADLDALEQKLSLVAAVTKIGGSHELYKRITDAMPVANPLVNAPTVSQHTVDMVKAAGGDPRNIPGYSANGSK